MSNEAHAWMWRGCFGLMAAAVAGKVITDALAPEIAGVKVPEAGEPPRPVDVGASMGMFAIQVRSDYVFTPPAGLLEADPAMVARMVNA